MLSGNVLITGGAGFLARGIYRRARRDGWDAKFTALSRDDSKHALLQQQYPEVDCVLADVGQSGVDYLSALMRGFDTVINAAASKHVDRGEYAAFDIVRTNVHGAEAVARAAIVARVARVIGVSTDKACLPVNNYGATKFLMERVFQEADRLGETRFHVVRYGNVAGSTGSVIPMFMQAVEEDRPIRLTDPRMTRFWMSIDEAIDVILHAVSKPQGGEVVVPMMRSMSMKDLVRMALGYEEHGELPEDGRVEIIGVRPGEKRHEMLMHRQESVRARYSPDNEFVYIGSPETVPTNADAWEISSDSPPAGLLGVAQMRAMIEDAATI